MNARSKISKDDILDSLSEGVFTIDTDFRITFFNRAAEQITGYRREEVIGQKCMWVCQSDFCDTECPIALVLKSSGNIYNFNSKIKHSSGKKIQVILNCAVLRDGGDEPVGGVISFRRIKDVTEYESLRNNPENFHGMVGHSKRMKEIFDLIREISCSDASVLISGPTGTGKELIADAIQATSLRANKPFVKVNCSVIPPQLLASELFGHAKGAFTDAKTDRIGRFEMADGGTIFLDEVAEMPTQMQIQLLRILQDGTFERVGESTTRKVNVRILAATNINIPEAISKGLFREDLYYRLSVIPIEVPPLRERMEDLIFLVHYFIKKFSLIYHREIENIDDDALEALMRHSWPGNIRELENVIEYSFIRSKKNKSICLCGLPPYLRSEIKCPQDESPNQRISEIKTTQLIQLLQKYNWNKTKVAKILGVNRTTIWRRLKAIGYE